ncbi:hypothetical protein F5148DRAFT_1289298 [Russula earlei]|uniref:Uncharacterized protein n=1 Tax=Russula earlei TaxID=71964 RepID=A0ACC0TXX5_9AGAM|nr:hypothetical protein F5148DRAFT_1289298 [Russula earlei]
MSNNPSPQFTAVLKFYEAIGFWKFDVLEKLFSEEYTSTTLPASANQPVRDKRQGIAYAKTFGGALGYAPLKYEIFQFIEGAGKIWAHSRFYNDDIKFNSESVFIFSLSSGDDIKITGVHDFIDTKLAADFAAAAAASAQAKQ